MGSKPVVAPHRSARRSAVECPLERNAQLLHCQPHARLNGPQRRIQNRRNLLLCHAPEVSELDRDSLVLWQLRERRTYLTLLIGKLGCDLRIDGLRIGRIIRARHRRDLSQATSPSTANLVNRTVSGDAHQPAHKSTACDVEESRLAPNTQKHLLSDVLRNAWVGDDSQGYRVDEVCVTMVKRLKSALVVVDNSLE
jgi:hypothetical protein